MSSEVASDEGRNILNGRTRARTGPFCAAQVGLVSLFTLHAKGLKGHQFLFSSVRFA